MCQYLENTHSLRNKHKQEEDISSLFISEYLSVRGGASGLGGACPPVAAGMRRADRIPKFTPLSASGGVCRPLAPRRFQRVLSPVSSLGVGAPDAGGVARSNGSSEFGIIRRGWEDPLRKA